MMMDIVSRMYHAAAGEDDWSAVIDGIREHVNADILMMGYGVPSAPEPAEIWGSGCNWTCYEESGYRPQDAWDPTINPAISAAMIVPPERSFDHRQFIPAETMHASDFMQRTVYGLGFTQDRLFVPLRDATVFSGGCIGKKRNRGFDNIEVQRFDYLLPHLGRAMRLRHQIARHMNLECGLSALLDQLHKAVFLIDRDLNVLFRNALAEDLIQDEAGISIKRGRLTLAEGTPVLLRALAEIDSDTLTAGAPPTISVKGSPDTPPLVARVYPGTGFAGVPSARRVAASVIVERPREAARPRVADLQCAFGLTRAEAAVAQVVPSSKSRKAIGETLGLSDNTIKSHLTAIRAKTGASSMVELVQYLNSIGD